MKKIYLILAIIGFVLPNIFVIRESLLTGNVLLWLDPKSTIKYMFANNVNSTFSIDLLYVVMIFFIWTYQQSVRYRINNVWIVWLTTGLFGLVGSFPLFLYLRDDKRKKKGTSTKTRHMSRSEAKSTSKDED
ncbi:MAG: DUF2834 domain-containing protein [Bacteroidetes bacterium]|nr:DUF2834 domain-containing protein [Bacteroidota bacterium]